MANEPKRTTIDVPPNLKQRVADVARASRLPITIAMEVILERALPDFESGKFKVAATALPIKSKEGVGA